LLRRGGSFAGSFTGNGIDQNRGFNTGFLSMENKGSN